jgi:hypothetical protein
MHLTLSAENFLAGLGWFPRGSGKERRLASALLGELVAILRVIEEHGMEERLQARATGSEDKLDIAGFSVPPVSVYQANVAHLDVFRPPLPRQIALLYTRLGALEPDLRAAAASGSLSGARKVLGELRAILEEADEVLRALRPLVSRRRPRSISRA